MFTVSSEKKKNRGLGCDNIILGSQKMSGGYTQSAYKQQSPPPASNVMYQ